MRREAGLACSNPSLIQVVLPPFFWVDTPGVSSSEFSLCCGVGISALSEPLVASVWGTVTLHDHLPSAEFVGIEI